MAEADGAIRVEGKIAEVELDRASGNIAALKLESGQRIEGDLFLDCTGFRALLIEQTLKAGFDDWTPLAAVRQRDRDPDRPRAACRCPTRCAIAHDSGWQWRIPLQHRTGNGIVYCSRYLDHDAALERLLGNIEGDTPDASPTCCASSPARGASSGIATASRSAFRAGSWSRSNRPPST